MERHVSLCRDGRFHYDGTDCRIAAALSPLRGIPLRVFTRLSCAASELPVYIPGNRGMSPARGVACHP